MNLAAKPLTCNSRLKEIYELRVTAWEHSASGSVINHQLFPNGWQDELDTNALHWIITSDQDKIIASARLNVFYRPEAFPYYPSLKQLPIPRQSSFGFCSRLVIHPEYRGLGLTTRLLTARLDYCDAHDLSWASAFVTCRSVKEKLGTLGFRSIGEIAVNYHKLTHPHQVEVFVRELLLVPPDPVAADGLTVLSSGLPA